MTNPLEVILSAIGFLVIVSVVLRNIGRRGRLSGDSADGSVVYDGLVKARVRRTPGPTHFIAVKNGFGGVYLTVSEESVRVAAGGPGAAIGRLLGVSYTFEPDSLTMRSESIGSLGTPVLRRHAIVISGVDRARKVEIALVPEDGDLDRLHEALASSGVAEASSPSSDLEQF